MIKRKPGVLIMFTAFAVFILGTFSAFSKTLWESQWKELDLYELPEDVVIHAEAPPEDYATAETSVATLMTNPDPSSEGASNQVLALRDGSRDGKEIAAYVVKDGFSESRAELSFDFYINTPQRNGSLLVCLRNREGQVLASFQLYATDREAGSIGLNILGQSVDRRATDAREVYYGKIWTPARLQYDGVVMKWSLQIGEKEFSDLPVDAAIYDTEVASFAIYSGFGNSSKTVLLLDHILFASLEP